MKINDKILSLPPYISTSWKNIVSLQVENKPSGLVLAIELITGSRIDVPHLDRPTLEKIFAAHAQYLEHESGQKKAPQSFTFPFPMNLPGLDGFNGILQHNLEQANSPELPPELLEKIVVMSNTMGLEDVSLLPKAEPHCNCPHCQIMRAIHGTQDAPAIEEEVSEADLKFRTWDINQSSDNLYVVTNPLEPKEHYSVFLGDPIGCTCGQKNCEHIQAVLKS